MKNVLTIVGAVALLGCVLWLAWDKEVNMAAALPPRTEVASQQAAWSQAQAMAQVNGWAMRTILGTGSMSEAGGYIPAAPAGWDPKQTIVALALLDEQARWDDIEVGSLCSYLSVDGTYRIIHQAAEQDGSGNWIMSGNANRRYEGGRWAMTPERFEGIFRHVYVWPLEGGD